MTPIKRNLYYFFRGESLLRLRISWAPGRILALSVGYHVDREKWDGERCRKNTTHGQEKIQASVINRVLEGLEVRIENAFLEFELTDRIPTTEELKRALNPREEKPKKVGLFEAYDMFLDDGANLMAWSENTTKKLKTFKKLLLKFDPKLRFEDLTKDTLKRLMAYQTKNAVMEESDKEAASGKALIKYKGRYQNDTINRNMKYLKWFLKWAKEKGLNDNLDFEGFNVKYKTTKRPVVFLTWDELMRMLELDLGNRPELEKTRDMFCFCCFTSLRYSDLDNLRWSDVHDGAIHVTSIKTSDNIVIELNKYSSALLEKYRGERDMPAGKIFESKSSQKMNVRLKEIGRLAGLTSPVHLVEMYGSKRKDITVPKYELLSTHCGRRTFICNALSLGIAPNVVMKWTGHSDYKAMEPYIDVADEIRRSSMDKFNQ